MRRMPIWLQSRCLLAVHLKLCVSMLNKPFVCEAKMQAAPSAVLCTCLVACSCRMDQSMCMKHAVPVQLVTAATGNQQVNSNDLNSLIQGVRLTQVCCLLDPLHRHHDPV